MKFVTPCCYSIYEQGLYLHLHCHQLLLSRKIWIRVSQTSFSLYFYNQWTNFHKLSCTEKLQMRAICTYMGCPKVTTNNWDIKPSVTVKDLLANISWMARHIHMIELTLKSTYQIVFNNIWYIIWKSVFIKI